MELESKVVGEEFLGIINFNAPFKILLQKVEALVFSPRKASGSLVYSASRLAGHLTEAEIILHVLCWHSSAEGLAGSVGEDGCPCRDCPHGLGER